MRRLQKLFSVKDNHILNMYCTVGFPGPDSTLAVIKSLQQGGADIIELGIPYSDPLADGPVIQSSGSKAIANGMTVKVLFDQLKELRKPVDGNGLNDIPVILMGYMNPVLQYGFEKFCKDAAAVGVDGFILPDLPMFEFENEYQAILKKYNLDFIFLVTPETSEERIRKLDELSTGFLYAVSSSSTTGNEKDFAFTEKYLQRLQQMKLKNKILVGFGIKDKQSFETACKYANGAIIGSAYIKALEVDNNVELVTSTFLKSILAAK